MKCFNCGHENNDGAIYCKNCGTKLDNGKKNNNKILVISLTVIIVILIITITLLFSGILTVNFSSSNIQNSISDNNSHNKSWVLIDSYSGSGSGSKSISVPEGQIRIDITSFPIKNYATNHLYVSGSNGAKAAVDWGPESAVASRSDSLSYNSSSSVPFTIDYYETVSWQVDVYRYQ